MKKLALVFLTLMLVMIGCSSAAKAKVIERTSDSQEGPFEGQPGDILRNEFFDFTVKHAETTDTFGKFTAAEGYKLLDITVSETNTFGETLPMFATDFIILWGDGDEDFDLTADGIQDERAMPDEFELEADKTVEYHLIFQVPADAQEFRLIYLEEFDDDTTGDLFIVNLTVK